MKRNKLTDKMAAIWLVTALIVVSVGVYIAYRFIKNDGLPAFVEETHHKSHKESKYWVVDWPTPALGEGKNDVKGVVLHHTASPSIESALKALASEKSKVSCHVLIDTDGTRYVLADPTAITWHAGLSRFNGRDSCNNFMVGIEFQGNTLEHPLTDEQVESAIDYLLPIIDHYNIPIKNIVSHEEIRSNYIEAHPKSKAHAKVDVTPEEKTHFIKELRKRLREK